MTNIGELCAQIALWTAAPKECRWLRLRGLCGLFLDPACRAKRAGFFCVSFSFSALIFGQERAVRMFQGFSVKCRRRQVSRPVDKFLRHSLLKFRWGFEALQHAIALEDRVARLWFFRELINKYTSLWRHELVRKN